MDIGLAVVMLVVPVRECDAGPALLVVPVREWSGTTESEAGARAGRAMRLRMGMRWDNTSYPNAAKLITPKGGLGKPLLDFLCKKFMRYILCYESNHSNLSHQKCLKKRLKILVLTNRLKKSFF